MNVSRTGPKSHTTLPHLLASSTGSPLLHIDRAASVQPSLLRWRPVSTVRTGRAAQGERVQHPHPNLPTPHCRMRASGTSRTLAPPAVYLVRVPAGLVRAVEHELLAVHFAIAVQRRRHPARRTGPAQKEDERLHTCSGLTPTNGGWCPGSICAVFWGSQWPGVGCLVSRTSGALAERWCPRRGATSPCPQNTPETLSRQQKN